MSEAFTKADVPFTGVCCMESREKKTRVTGINLDKFPFNAEEFKKYMRLSCGIHVTEPSFDISEKGGVVLSFERAPVIAAEYAYAGEPMENTEANGDTVAFPTADKNLFYALYATVWAAAWERRRRRGCPRCFWKKCLPQAPKSP